MGDDVDTCALWLSSLTSHKLSQAPLSPPKPSQALTSLRQITDCKAQWGRRWN